MGISTIGVYMEAQLFHAIKYDVTGKSLLCKLASVLQPENNFRNLPPEEFTSAVEKQIGEPIHDNYLKHLSGAASSGAIQKSVLDNVDYIKSLNDPEERHRKYQQLKDMVSNESREPIDYMFNPDVYNKIGPENSEMIENRSRVMAAMESALNKQIERNQRQES